MSDQTYEGWTNWETWVTLSWIENDEDLYKRILSTTKECLRNKRPKSNLAFKLERMVDGLVDDKILPDYQTGLVMEYIQRGISKVNFDELADKYLDTVMTDTERRVKRISLPFSDRRQQEKLSEGTVVPIPDRRK